MPCSIETHSYGSVLYEDIGPRDGQVILFSSGGGASFESIHEFTWLTEAGFRLISINRPGYLGFPVDIVSSIEGHADIYHEVIETLGITEKIMVFGVSMGGLSALYYASKYPTQALVLWSAITGQYTVNKASTESPLGKMVLSKGGKRIISWLFRKSVRWFPRATIKSFLEAEADLTKSELNEIVTQMMKDPESLRNLKIFVDSLTPMEDMYEGMMDEVEKSQQPDSIHWESIDMPVFAVHSTIDKDVSLDHPKRLEEEVKNLDMKYITGAGHFVWWGDEGKKVKQETLQFFQDQSTSSYSL